MVARSLFLAGVSVLCSPVLSSALREPTNTVKARTQIGQIFCEFAKLILEARAAGVPFHPPAGPINDSFVIRSGLSLYGSLARSYNEKIQQVIALGTKDGFWSADSLEEVFADHLVAVLTEGKESAIQRQARLLADDLGAVPKTYGRRVAVFGFADQFDDFEFGLLRIKRQVYTPNETFGPFLTKSVPYVVHYAEVSVTAVDDQSASVQAQSMVEKHLAVLNALFSQRASSITFLTRTFAGAYSLRMTQVLNDEGEWQTLRGSSRVRFPITREEAQENYDSRAGAQVSSLLKRPDGFAQRVITGFELAGNACIEPTPHTAFLLFAIALESAVLGPGTQVELSRQLATRVAHLLCRSMSCRKSTSRAVKRIYAIRSKIVHSGSRDVTETQVSEIRQVCLRALLTLCASDETASFTSSQQLENWFEEKVLESAN